MPDNKSYQVLMDAITDAKPDLSRVRKAAKEMGFKAEGDLLQIMAEVLRFLDRQPHSAQNLRRPTDDKEI